MANLAEQLKETWEIHNRINLHLLKAIQEEDLIDTLSSRGRNVREQFGHMHNVRLMWLKVANHSSLKNQSQLSKELILTKDELEQLLMESGEAIGLLLQNGLEEGKIKGFKPHPVAFLGYLISHESHHRGQIILALKQSGHPIDRKVQYGIWEWGVR